MILFRERQRDGPKLSRGDEPDEGNGGQIEKNGKGKRPEIILGLIEDIPSRNKVFSSESRSLSCVKTNLTNYRFPGSRKTDV